MRVRLLPIVERRVGVALRSPTCCCGSARSRSSRHPWANAFWQDGRIGINAEVNIGLAVVARDSSGLVVPVLRDADRKPLSQIAEERTDLVERARAGTLRPEDLAGGTFTLTNLGMYRVDTFQAILQSATVCHPGRGPHHRPRTVLNGQLAARPTAVRSR